MEESDGQSEADGESQKLLYKYQYAFLHMQKSFTSLFKIVRLYENKVCFRYLVRWKSRFSNMVLRVKFGLFRARVKEVEKKFKWRTKLSLFKYFHEILKASNYLQFFKTMKNKFKNVQESNKKELNVMESEVLNLRKSQSELEGLSKKSGKRDKIKLDSPSNKGLLEKLKSENRQLKEEIFEIDKKSFGLFRDLNLIMDELEEAKKKKLKKLKKKTKAVVKGKHLFPIST